MKRLGVILGVGLVGWLAVTAGAQTEAEPAATTEAPPTAERPALRGEVTGRVTLTAGRDLHEDDGTYLLSLKLDVSWPGELRCITPPDTWQLRRFDTTPAFEAQPRLLAEAQRPTQTDFWRRYLAIQRSLMLFVDRPAADPSGGATLILADLDRRPRSIDALQLTGEAWFAEPADAWTMPDAWPPDGLVRETWRIESARLDPVEGDADAETYWQVKVIRATPRDEGPFPHPERVRDVPVGLTLLDDEGGPAAEVPLGWVSPEAEDYDASTETYLVKVPIEADDEYEPAGVQVWFVPSVTRRSVTVQLEEVVVP